MSAQDKLARLQAERAEIEATRTREDLKALAEHWLAAALVQVNGSANYVLNGHIGPAEVQAVLAEYLLESPALVDFITAKVTAQAQLSAKQKAARLKKLDDAIGAARGERQEAEKAAALREVEERFSPAA
jgi:hypothetical protein